MTRFVHGTQHLALLITRLVLGVVLIVRGWRRWQVTGLEHQVSYLERSETPYAEQLATAAVFLEIGGGVLLIIGLVTPVIAALLLVQQILIVVWTKWFKGLSLNGPLGDGWEYTVVTACVCLLFLVYGAGKVSIDGLLRRGRSERRDFDDYGAD